MSNHLSGCPVFTTLDPSDCNCPAIYPARLALARDAWTAALLAGDTAEADRCAALVAALEADAL